jgi:hypothetical protein
VGKTEEYSLENILSYMDIQEYKRTLNDPLNIYFRYFNGVNSTLEVNAPRKQCLVVQEMLKNGQFDGTLFNELEKTVIANLCDTWSRFIFNSSYVKYMGSKSIEKEMIEGK